MTMLNDIEYICYDNRSCRYEDLIEELRADLATLTEQNAQQADSLHHWAVLWEHIEARLGESMLPNESNFDKMLLAAQPPQVTP